jgi:hypothetical protein
MPFWSDRAYAQQCAREDWSEYEPAAIPIDQFMERWLPGMAADGTLVGTNWNVQRIGVSKAIFQGATKYGDEARLVNDVGKGWERSEIHGGRVLGKVYGVVSGPGAQSFTRARG